MTTQAEARDAVALTINTAWLASGVTSSFALQWDDVKSDPPGHDANGLPLTYARVMIRTLSSTQETLGGPGNRKHMNEGLVRVQVFTPFGDGHALADAIAEVLKASMRNVRVGDLWFFDVVPLEGGQDGAYFRTDVQAGFFYVDRS